MLRSSNSMIASFLLFATVACAKSAPPESAAAPKTAAPPAESAAPIAPAASSSAKPTASAALAPGGDLAGSVLETMDSGGYTYIRMKTEIGEVWAAVGRSTVKVGDQVTVVRAMPMGQFESPSLKRKFDQIYFGTLGPAGGSAAAALSNPATKAEVAAQHSGVGSTPADLGKIAVAKAEGPDGRLVAEVHAQRKALAGKPVAVRGKVVKFNGGILGKNWIHLRDGSGRAADKSDDLTVTTGDVAAVGDTVLIRGTLRLDKDFGAGYVYPVIVEDAKVSK
jgi:hypothetical protein